MTSLPITPESVPLSCPEAADLGSVSTSTVNRMCDEGVLKTHRTRGGHRHIGARALTDLRRTRDLAKGSGDEANQHALSGFESEISIVIQGGVFDADQRIAWLFHDAQAYARVLCWSIRVGQASLTHLLDFEIIPILARVGDLWSQRKMAVF